MTGVPDRDEEKSDIDVKQLEHGSGEGVEARHTSDPSDPLNWPLKIKIACLVQISILAALGGLNTAIINPAYVPMSKELGITTIRASYQTTIVIAVNGIAPFLWVPLANVYGRRPFYLVATFIGVVSALGCAYVDTFGQLLAARFFNGWMPVAFSLGAITVVDLFPYEQRGRAMGVYTVMMTNGSHLAPIFGGLLGQYCGWRWNFKFAAILNACIFVIILFCLPETLYNRNHLDTADSPGRTEKLTYKHAMRFWTSDPDLKLRANQFVLPAIKMMRYPSVIFPALYYGAQYGFASILPAVTVASIFSKFFHWDTLQTGVAYGLALTIGASLGEICAGTVVDAIVKRERRKLGGLDPEPEVRLRAIWTGQILVPAGLLIYGFTLQYHVLWIGPILGMGIACFGLQTITTVCYTYSADSYRLETGETAQVFNFWRQTFGFTFAFYTLPLAEKIGYQWLFVFFAIMGSVLGFLPMLGLMAKGAEWRRRLGRPKNVNAFDTEEYHR